MRRFNELSGDVDDEAMGISCLTNFASVKPARIGGAKRRRIFIELPTGSKNTLADACGAFAGENPGTHSRS
jgi:hypothetical protein